eukprot:3161834-Karenia_brevis.AAC.1
MVPQGALGQRPKITYGKPPVPGQKPSFKQPPQELVDATYNRAVAAAAEETGGTSDEAQRMARER